MAPPCVVSLIIVGTTNPLLFKTASPWSSVRWPTTRLRITPFGVGRNSLRDSILHSSPGTVMSVPTVLVPEWTWPSMSRNRRLKFLTFLPLTAPPSSLAVVTALFFNCRVPTLLRGTDTAYAQASTSAKVAATLA